MATTANLGLEKVDRSANGTGTADFFDDYNDNLDTVDTNVADLEADLAAAIASAVVQNGVIDDLSFAVEALQGDRDAAQADIADLQADLAALTATVTALSTTVTTHITTYNTLIAANITMANLHPDLRAAIEDAAAQLMAHELRTTGIHGIVNTANLSVA